jgi:hypothetical protein
MSSGYIAPDWWRDKAIPLLSQAFDEFKRGKSFESSEMNDL